MTGIKGARNFLENDALDIAAKVGNDGITFWSFEFLRFCNRLWNVSRISGHFRVDLNLIVKAGEARCKIFIMKISSFTCKQD